MKTKTNKTNNKLKTHKKKHSQIQHTLNNKPTNMEKSGGTGENSCQHFANGN